MWDLTLGDSFPTSPWSMAMTFSLIEKQIHMTAPCMENLRVGMTMKYKNLMKNMGDHRILSFAHIMLDGDEGLSEKQYLTLEEFVYDELGPTEEMQDLFSHVKATDDRFYIRN